MIVEPWKEEDEDDWADVDCAGCGLKFFVRPSLYTEEAQARRARDGMPPKEWPRRCPRCVKGIPPPYEY